MAHHHKSNRRRGPQRPKRYVSKKTKWAIALSALAVILIALTAVAFIQGWIKLPERPDPEPAETTVATEPAEDSVIHIVAGGDVNVTDHTVAAGKSSAGYDYAGIFLDVMPVLSGGDLTLLNFEGNVYGEPYGTEMRSAPAQLLSALRGAGVDVLQTANSQSITNGLLGLAATKTAIEDAGMQALGTYADEADYEKYRGYLIYDIGGIRVALVAFTKGMDGRNLPQGNDYCVNLLYTDYSSTYASIDTEGITRVLEAVELEKPDITIAMLHWGSEYNDQLSSTQTKICKLLASLGVDAVIGSHPHYVQKMGFDEDTGLFVAYSLGDLLGDADVAGTNYSVLLDLEITKDGATGETAITGFTYTPLYLDSSDGGFRVLRINEAVSAYENNSVTKVSDEIYQAMKSALERIESRISGS